MQVENLVLPSDPGGTDLEVRIAAVLDANARDDIRRLEQRKKGSANAKLSETFAEYERQTKRFRNFLAVQKESIRVLFQLTATQQFGKHYAASKVESDCDRKSSSNACVCGGCSAIPADNGKPQYESLFGSSLERLYYTALMFINPRRGPELEDILLDIVVRTVSRKHRLSREWWHACVLSMLTSSQTWILY